MPEDKYGQEIYDLNAPPSEPPVYVPYVPQPVNWPTGLTYIPPVVPAPPQDTDWGAVIPRDEETPGFSTLTPEQKHFLDAAMRAAAAKQAFEKQTLMEAPYDPSRMTWDEYFRRKTEAEAAANAASNLDYFQRHENNQTGGYSDAARTAAATIIAAQRAQQEALARFGQGGAPEDYFQRHRTDYPPAGLYGLGGLAAPVGTTGGGGGGGAPAGIDPVWWEAFKRDPEHKGMDPLTFYKGDLNRALYDKQWGENFARGANRAPTIYDWKASYPSRTAGYQNKVYPTGAYNYPIGGGYGGGGGRYGGGGTEPPTQPSGGAESPGVDTSWMKDFGGPDFLKMYLRNPGETMDAYYTRMGGDPAKTMIAKYQQIKGFAPSAAMKGLLLEALGIYGAIDPDTLEPVQQLQPSNYLNNLMSGVATTQAGMTRGRTGNVRTLAGPRWDQLVGLTRTWAPTTAAPERGVSATFMPELPVVPPDLPPGEAIL